MHHEENIFLTPLFGGVTHLVCIHRGIICCVIIIHYRDNCKFLDTIVHYTEHAAVMSCVSDFGLRQYA